MQNNLNKIWQSELDRFRPEQAPLSLGELLAQLVEKIAGLIESLLKRFDFNNRVTPENLKHAAVLLLAITALLLIIYLYRRRHDLPGLDLKKLSCKKNEAVRAQYAGIVSSGDYTAALRFLVRFTANSSRGMARTFRELFRRSESHDRNEGAAIYGRALHCGSNAGRSDLEKCEKLVSLSYPDIYKKICGKNRP